MGKFKQILTGVLGGQSTQPKLPPAPPPIAPPVKREEVTIDPEDPKKKKKGGGITQLTSAKRLTGGRDADALGGGNVSRPGEFGSGSTTLG